MTPPDNNGARPWRDYWQFRAEIEPELAAKREALKIYENNTPRPHKQREAYGKRIK